MRNWASARLTLDRGERRRFTLLELVVVLSILVLLAGGLVAQLDVLSLRANKGAAASDMAGISRLLQTYKITNNHYPNRFDSLVDQNGGTPQLWGTGLADQTTPSLDPSLIGRNSRPDKLLISTLAAGEVVSLTRMGITELMTIDATATPVTSFPSDAFSGVNGGTIVPITDTPTPTSVAILNSTLNGAPAPGEGDADAIMQQFYPQTAGVPPTGKRVVVFGLGPMCTLIGRSGMIQEAPLYANSSDRTLYYARDLVCFEVDDGGSRARFLGALGGDGDRLDEEIEEYYEIE